MLIVGLDIGSVAAKGVMLERDKMHRAMIPAVAGVRMMPVKSLFANYCRCLDVSGNNRTI